MEMKEKIEIHLEIAKFKVLYFAGVLSAGSFLVINYQKFVDFFGSSSSIYFKVGVVGVVSVLFFYGLAGITKNIRILTNIYEEIGNE